MKGRRKIFLCIAAGVLMAASAFLLFSVRREGSSDALSPSTTLRNVTRAAVEYAVRNPATGAAGSPRRLKAGELDRIRTVVPVVVVFHNGAGIDTQRVLPGMPYSFRYDSRNLIRLYPGSHGNPDAADLAPFVPTPHAVVRRMLEMAGVGAGDVVYDLGCGDGRIVIAAARDFGARGVGIDIEADLVRECREEARRARVESSVRFVRMDATRAHLTEADVVAVYLLPESLEVLRPLFERDLRNGARVVAHNYRVPGWESREVQSDAVLDADGIRHTIFLYRK